MPDNDITAAPNTTPGNAGIASDDIGGVHFQRIKLIHGADNTNDGDVSTANPLPVEEQNTISTNNSTTTPLGISGNFTGTPADDVSGYSAVTITLDSDQDSATDGMTFEFSTDNTNWDDTYSFTYTAAGGARRFQFPTTAQYFRVNYTNGGTGQTTFRVQTILHRHNVITSVHRLEDDTSPDRSAQVVKAAILAQQSGAGNFVPVASNANGRLQVAAEVEGPAAENAPVSGNPVLAGGRYDAAPRTLGDGDVGAVALDADGAVHISDGGNTITVDGTVTSTPSGTQNVDVTANTVGLATAANQLADGHNVTVDNVAGTNSVPVQGDAAHDVPVAGNPVLLGAEAQNVGATPTAVADGDVTRLQATRYGQLYTLGGHMNVTRREYRATTAQTNDPIIDAVAAGNRIVITEISVLVDNATTVSPQVRIGFGTASVPTEPADGGSVDGMVVAASGLAAGSGIVHGSGSGIVAVGGDGEELRITSDAPTTGEIKVVVTYYVSAA